MPLSSLPGCCSLFTPLPRRRAPPKGAAVTVLKPSKFCFGNIVEVSGIIMLREETQIRPDRFGLKVAEVMADAGDTVTAGRCWRG
jgi:HlyD family secretion protein